MEKQKWPVLQGSYTVVNPNASISVLTLFSDIKLDLNEVALYGRALTENLGIERVVTNLIANPNIRFLIVCGEEVTGHFTGQSIVSLSRFGLDENKRIINSKGAIPFLENLPQEAVNRFREQVQVIDLTGTQNKDTIIKEIKRCALENQGYFGEPFFVTKKEKEKKINLNLGENIAVIDAENKIVFDPETGVIGEKSSEANQTA
ncbi:MAG: tetrahydromethanopterin S-methyltransferase subunit A [Candidatus Diapherotrites archaeon]|nr:tetrahydromethanopterin S-methyltransferase subunit A [Candidatus Diapherotrites archaeon]